MEVYLEPQKRQGNYSGNKKKNRNEPAHETENVSTPSISSRALKSGIKTVKLRIFMVRKPVHGMWTPLSLGLEEIIPLNLPVIIVNDSTLRVSSIIDHSYHVQASLATAELSYSF